MHETRTDGKLQPAIHYSQQETTTRRSGLTPRNYNQLANTTNIYNQRYKQRHTTTTKKLQPAKTAHARNIQTVRKYNQQKLQPVRKYNQRRRENTSETVQPASTNTTVCITSEKWHPGEKLPPARTYKKRQTIASEKLQPNRCSTIDKLCFHESSVDAEFKSESI